MSEPLVNPRGAQFTDEDLRADLANGLTQADVARKYGVSRAAVSKRVNRLELTTAATASAPDESRVYTQRQLDAMEQLLRGLGRVNKLMDACDEWLRDPARPECYDVGPRAEEVTVCYQVVFDTDKGPKVEKRKAPLSRLLAAVENAPGLAVGGEQFYAVTSVESRHADPRELVLKTVQESRQTVSTVADLARMLADHRAMTALREAIIAEVARVEPEVAQRIADAVRRSILLNAALGGPGALPAATASGAAQPV